MVDIKRVLDYLEIKNYEIVERVETDDVVASYVAELKENYSIYILSTDTDFLQLVENNVKVFVYRGKKSIVYDKDAIISKYGIAPQYFADYKSLTGDSSDNITGIRGIGQKTAKKLIDTFGRIEDIIKNVDLIEKDSIRSSIKDNVEVLLANIRLIKLSQKTAIPFKIDTLRINNYDDYKTMEILKNIELI